MPSLVLQVDPHAPDPAIIQRAAAVVRGGGLVAFPTETVYGLGANALDAQAVAGIFTAKGRPARNPLIVHVPDVTVAQRLVTAWPAHAQRLAEAFWPGPLTFVLWKQNIVPDLVTASGATVALRVPAHPVALALLQACGLPLAAPSANRSNYLSPTRAEHVLASLGDRFDLLLDGGPTPGGLESTVLDLTTEPPRLLRPGLVTCAQLEARIGPVARTAADETEKLRSPGQLAKHYAPTTPLECVTGNGWERVRGFLEKGHRIGWLTFDGQQSCEHLVRMKMPQEPIGYSAQFYAALFALDTAGLDRIIVDLPPATEAWLAIHDRLRRAAQG